MEYLAGNIEIQNNPIEEDLWDKIVSKIDGIEGIFGYRIPSLGTFDPDDTPTFILRGPLFGIMLIDVISEKVTEFDDDNEYWTLQDGQTIYSRDLILSRYQLELEARLKKNKDLFNLRNQKWKHDFPIRRYLIFHENTSSEIEEFIEDADSEITGEIIGSNNLEEWINTLDDDEDINIPNNFFDVIDSSLDGSDVFKKTKKGKISEDPVLVSDYIKKSLNFTFKLDRTQRQIALQVPSGPQRIRGLAGTGKTVILCMKAALAHKAFPDLKILFVFNTQSMYNMIRSAITEYYFNEARKMPDFDNLHIYHAWGGSSKKGLYSDTANSIGIRPKTYMDVKLSDNPLEAIYEDLLNGSRARLKPTYDIVLIDEAQDFSPAFFETIFHLTKRVGNDPLKKRIIWAYDEFQSLTELKITEPEQLFGRNGQGEPNMPNAVLAGSYKGKIQKDFVLPKSYRNPRINLMVAHGIALGLYSEYGKVPMDNSRDWEARGYTIVSPDKAKFSEGDEVVVERPEENSKNILEQLLREDDFDEKNLVAVHRCDTNIEQLTDVVAEIKRLVEDEKVKPEEILVINLDIRNARNHYEFIRQKLDFANIGSITPGFIEATDAFAEKGFVTLSTTFRAKGNESNIVFILNAQRVIEDVTFKLRNAIFVSITRSRGWAYIYGFGDKFEVLEKEIEEIKELYPRFRFEFPSEDQIRRKLVIINSDKDLEKADRDLDNMLNDEALRALLIEKLAKDPSFIRDIKKQNPPSADENR